MKAKSWVLSLAVLQCPMHSWGQNAERTTQAFGGNAQAFGIDDKFSYHLTETYLNASAFTGLAFRAGIRMTNPPGKGLTQYPRSGGKAPRLSAETTGMPSHSVWRFRPRASQRE
jgi:hypothetical protein